MERRLRIAAVALVLAWFFVLAAVLLSAGAGFMAYNVGVSHGLAQTAVAQGVPAPPYGYPYWRPWGFGFGFPILFFVLLWFVLLALWAAIAAFRRGSSTAARTIAQAGQGFSNPVVSLSNHGDARAAVLRQAQDEVCMRGNVFSEEGYGQQRQCLLDLHA